MGERRVKAEKLSAAEGRKDFTLGITRIEGGFHICTVADCEELNLIVYEGGSRAASFAFPENQRMGNVWSMDLLGDFEGLEYCLESDGREIPDLLGRAFSGREVWGDTKALDRPVRNCFPVEVFDWEGDRPLKTPYEESVIYHIHTRGFTKHPSSKVKEKGTFSGIQAKIPYLKELGVTAVELMPPNEFQEVIERESSDRNPSLGRELTGKLNYWGYGKGWYFAPKASYASGKQKAAGREFKELVKALHQNKMELIIELYFSGQESAALVQEAVRFWVCEYHVDGVHLVGFPKTGLLAGDPLLADTKLWAVSWEQEKQSRFIGEYNDGFMVDMRRVLKGDEDSLNNLIFRTRRNPQGYGVINYMANTNGFTMMDMVSYDRKHNEANGEENRDGSDQNFSWNCGVEGPTRRKKIVGLRRKQLKNAFLLLFLSQGTPLLLSGDEFGSSKGGNNNSYCQDNETSWLNWELLNTNQDIAEFVKAVIAFRKKHPVFHMQTEPKNIDDRMCGYPDVSYHGVKTWSPEFESFRRQLGILYCGDYCVKADGEKDDYLFVIYNMHWEPHKFALPNLPKKMKWHLAVNTDETEQNGIYTEGKEPVLKDQKQYALSPRSIAVLLGRQEIE